jgi:hypothetical protein
MYFFNLEEIMIFLNEMRWVEVTRDAKVSVQMSRPIVYKRKALEA